MINITLEEARELYKQGSLAKEIALRAFPEGEIVNDYKQVISLPKEIDCKTDILYAKLMTAYRQMTRGRKVKLISGKCYLPEIILTTSTVPRNSKYKGKVEIDGKLFAIYIRAKESNWFGRLGYDDMYCGGSVLENTWAFKEWEQAEYFVNLFYEELICISLMDIYNVIFVDDNGLPF